MVTTTVSEAPPTDEDCTDDDVARLPEGGQLVSDAGRPIIITPDTPNGAEAFAEVVAVGSCGSPHEKGLESAYRALTPPDVNGYNAGFLRDEAFLSLIFVSNEEDVSPLPVDDYVNAYRSVKGQTDRAITNASALVVTDEADCDEDQQASAQRGARYVEVARMSQGVVGSICTREFTELVADLSLVSSRLTDTFTLSALPNVASLEVYVDDGTCGDGDDLEGCRVPCDGSGAYTWTYDLRDAEGASITECTDDTCRGAIVFDRDNLPPVQSRVNARYDFGGGDPGDFCTGKGDE